MSTEPFDAAMVLLRGSLAPNQGLLLVVVEKPLADAVGELSDVKNERLCDVVRQAVRAHLMTSSDTSEKER